jgi:hypothetical protein
MKRNFEAFLLRLAALIIDRNVKRSMVVTRKDNNWLFEAEHKLKEIAGRITSEYKEL